MYRLVILLALVPILGVFNYSIYEKESLKAQSEVILLEIAPADPRSLMQGDYMRLRYVVVNDANNALRKLRNANEDRDLALKSNLMVLELDDQKKARFVGFHHDGLLLAANQRLFSFSHAKKAQDIAVLPTSFFFQEGKAHEFENARFAAFRVGADGNHLLVALADDNGNVINEP